MKKRIILILTVGISFAPAVFASKPLSDYKPNVATTGESSPPAGSFLCGFSADKHLQGNADSRPAGRTGTATGAR